MKAKINDIREPLALFKGTERFYTFPLCKTRFTDGIKYLAEAANCYWLVTDTSIMAKSLKDRSEFVTIDFKRFQKEEQTNRGYEAEITYGDGNNTILIRQQYHITDFPMDDLRMFFVNDTLMLPGEY